MMAEEIKNLQKFMDAVLVEFWADHPEAYQSFCYLLGTRIQDVQKGELSEEEYIEEYTEAKTE